MGSFFIIGVMVGQKSMLDLIKAEIKDTDRMVIKNKMYRVYEHCDLAESSGFPEEIQNIPASKNREPV